MVADFAAKIDVENTAQILQYGAGTQKKMADFSDAALANVRTQDLGEVGDVIVAVDDETCSTSNALIAKLQEFQEGDVITVKVYRAEGMTDFYDHQDLSKVGDGEYIDLTVTLRVIENVAS